jgi:hypothetical protein
MSDFETQTVGMRTQERLSLMEYGYAGTGQLSEEGTDMRARNPFNLLTL